MRSFLLAPAALCLASVFAGCDAPVDTPKANPPAAPGTPEPGPKMEGPAPAPSDKMAPAMPPEKPAGEKMDPPK